MRLYLLAVLLLAVPAYASESVNISFNINSDLSVEEIIAIDFGRPMNEPIDYTLYEAISSVEVKDSSRILRHELVKSDSKYILRIYPQGDDKITIKFVSKSLVFQNNDIYQFFTELSFAEEVKLDVSVILPEGYGVYQNSYRPGNASVSTNGRNIEISWSLSDSEPRIFSVKLERLNREFNVWALATIIALAAAAFIYRHHKKVSEEKEEKAKHEFFTGFREDEKKVIEYMEKHKTAYQNKVEQEFKFSRAKMTRIVQKLAEKKLLAKKKKGRTNRLIWLKEN